MTWQATRYAEPCVVPSPMCRSCVLASWIRYLYQSLSPWLSNNALTDRQMYRSYCILVVWFSFLFLFLSSRWCGLCSTKKEWRSRLIVSPITGFVSPFYLYITLAGYNFHIYSRQMQRKMPNQPKKLQVCSIHLMQHCLLHWTRIELLRSLGLLSPNCLFACF